MTLKSWKTVATLAAMGLGLSTSAQGELVDFTDDKKPDKVVTEGFVYQQNPYAPVKRGKNRWLFYDTNNDGTMNHVALLRDPKHLRYGMQASIGEEFVRHKGELFVTLHHRPFWVPFGAPNPYDAVRKKDFADKAYQRLLKDCQSLAELVHIPEYGTCVQRPKAYVQGRSLEVVGADGKTLCAEAYPF